MAQRMTRIYRRHGVRKEESFSHEKEFSAKAAYDLLQAYPKDIREEYRDWCLSAQTSGELSRIMKEVRDKI